MDLVRVVCSVGLSGLYVFGYPWPWLGLKVDLVTRLLTHYNSLSPSLPSFLYREGKHKKKKKCRHHNQQEQRVQEGATREAENEVEIQYPN